MQKEKGYLLPDSAYTEDMACTLVYYPDKPEYRRALLGSLAYLATWIAWEKESEHKGIDAALSWKIALDLTVECWQMACLEQLQDDVAEILAIMRIPPSCCEETDVTDGDQYTDRVVDGVGDVPQNIIDAGYASGASDWAGFDDYKCMIAYMTVDQLSARTLKLVPYVNAAGMAFGGVATIAAIAAVVFGTGGLALVFGLVMATGAVALLYENLMEGDLLVILAAKVVTNRDELACAIYNADGDVGALVALNDKIDELFTSAEALLLKNWNLGPTLKAFYAGRYDQQDIAEILNDAGYDLGDFTCDCDQIGEFMVFCDFNDGTLQGWENNSGFMDPTGGIGGSYSYRATYGQNHWIGLSTGGLFDIVSESRSGVSVALIHRLKFSYRMTIAGVHQVLAQFYHDGGHEEHFFEDFAAFTEEEIIFDPPLESTYQTQAAVQIVVVTGATGYLHLDNVTIDFDLLIDQ